MAGETSFWERLRLILIPTRTQALACLAASLLIVILAGSRNLLLTLGLSADFLDATQNEFHTRFDAILRSNIASQLALVTFWAVVGLAAYLVCWGAYNIMIEARNEVTLTTAYTNRGHWRGPFETLALKALAAVGLGAGIFSLSAGVPFWLALAMPAFFQLNLLAIGLAVLAAAGFAVHLYICLMFFQLTFTPWYRSNTFTEG